MHIIHICTYIFVQLLALLALMYLRRYAILLVENKKHGSAKELQLLCTCAGDMTTYTTGFPRTDRDSIPFFGGRGKRNVVRSSRTM